VKKPWLFVWNELFRRRRVTATYRLRESGVAITIRHKSHDILILDEIFSQHEYELPESVQVRLGSSPKVADIGANIGLFGAWILGRFPDAEILALEPDPANAEVHRRTIEANHRSEYWKLLEVGAMSEPGTLRFASGSFTTSHVARPGEAGIDVEGVDVFPLLAGMELVKLDIEGAEWPILEDPRFRELDAACIALEYHPEGSPPNGTGVIWAVRSALSDQT
jgi:FkbM family methyltransferase